MQNKYIQNKGAEVIKRLEAEIWFENQTKLSYTEFKLWIQKQAKA